MARTKIGQVSILPCGVYDPTKKYERLSVVYNEGCSYIAVKESQGQLVTNTEYWYKLTEKGDKGDTYQVTEEDLEVIANRITEDANSKFNTNVSEKTTEFNKNAEAQANTFNENVTTKTNTFNNNATEKTTAFNKNASTKTTDFNNNATEKTTAFDENAAAQTNTFNENAENKLAEFNANVDVQRITKLEKKVDQAETILPTQTASGENVYIDNAVNYPLMRLKGEGKCEQVTTTGKNFIDINALISGKVPSTSTGELVELATGTTTDFIEIDNSKSYVFSYKLTNAQTCYLFFYDENYGFIGSQYVSASVTANYNLNNYANYSSSKYIRVRIDSLPTNISEIQLEEGTEATPYEPYTGGEASPNPDYPQEITTVTEAEYKGVTENLYNYKDTKEVTKGITVDNDGWITATYDNTSGTTAKYLNYFTNNLNLETNKQYTVILEVKSVSGNGSMRPYSKYEKMGQFKSEYNISFSDLSNNSIKILNPYTKESFENVVGGLRTFVGFGAGASGSITFRISVLQDTSITAENFVYKPYQEITLPIDLQGNELCKVGTVADKLLIDRKGNVAIEKKIEKLVLNGSEAWIIDALQSGLSYRSFTHLLTNKPLVEKGKNGYIISNKLIKLDGQLYYGDNEGIEINWNERIRIKILNSDLISEYALKNWLVENPIITYYVLATPEIINLGTIENPEIFKGINNIVVETNLGNMNVEIEYVEDLQARLEKVEQAIISLGGI